MSSRLLAVLIVIVLVVGSAVSVVKKACKSGYHTWCVPVSTVRHQAKSQPPA